MSNTPYLLQHLARKPIEGPAFNVEYRLVCSGEFFNRKVCAPDWRKSDVTRVLLREPLELFVVSRPFDAYPQELCLRFFPALVSTKAEFKPRDMPNAAAVPIHSTFHPDEEIADDTTAILTLLSRRLVTLVTKTRELWPPLIGADDKPMPTMLGTYGSELPMPIVPTSSAKYWKERSGTVIYRSDALELIDNRPLPIGVDPVALATFMRWLPEHPSAPYLVYAARLYRTAMELIESQPDIAYQLLISVTDTLAGIAFKEWKPDEVQMLKSRQALLDLAKKLGVANDVARQLALETCRNNPWSKRKFVKFLIDHIDAIELQSRDDLFPYLLPQHCPRTEDVPATIDSIYAARSGNLHSAVPFPRSVKLGTAPRLDLRDLPESMFAPDTVPPVAWFERVVSLAVRRYLIGQTPSASAFEPFKP